MEKKMNFVAVKMWGGGVPQTLALLGEHIFFTTFYSLYFNHQFLHITLYNFFKFLLILVDLCGQL